MLKSVFILLFSYLYYLIKYTKTYYINHNTNIYKSLKKRKTKGFLRFSEI